MNRKGMLMSVSGGVAGRRWRCCDLRDSRQVQSLKVPGGTIFSEFRGYESWEVIVISHKGDHLAAIVGIPR